MIILMTEDFVHNCTLSDCNASYLYNIQLESGIMRNKMIHITATNKNIVYTPMITYNARFYSSRYVCPPPSSFVFKGSKLPHQISNSYDNTVHYCGDVWRETLTG